MRKSSIWAAETKVRGNFAQCWTQSCRSFALNKSKNLLLPLGQFFHTGQMSSTGKFLSSSWRFIIQKSGIYGKKTVQLNYRILNMKTGIGRSLALINLFIVVLPCGVGGAGE